MDARPHSGSPSNGRPVAVTVNGRGYERTVPPRLLLSDFLRHELELTGTRVGCEHGVCGACTVLLDGEPVRSCLLFAVQAHGHELRTVEGLAEGDGVPGAEADGAEPAGENDGLHPLQSAFREAHGLQCGFCTPGILMTLLAFLRENPDPSEAEIRDVLSGHLCRCTGYQFVVEAAKEGAARLREDAGREAAAPPGEGPAEARDGPAAGRGP